MADHFLERLREVEKKQQEDAKKQQELSQKISPTFGGRFKTSLNPEFVKQIEEIELLTPEEREILLVARTNASEKHLKSIRNNVLFFFWVTVISAVLAVLVAIMSV